MILYSIIVRIRDGLALSASTDADSLKEVRENRKYLKLLAKKLMTLPSRCSLKSNSCVIHFASSLGVCFMVLCETTYPSVLAFSFLDELMREFATLYTTKEVNDVLRPYAFIQFDHFIQKTKQRYNNPRSLTTRLDLSELSAEIKAQPPALLSLQDVIPKESNGLPLHITVGVTAKLTPVTWIGFFSMILTCLCSLLNFARAMSALSQSTFEEYDGSSPAHGLTFLFEAFLQLCQVYLLLNYTRWKMLETSATLMVICACNMLVWEIRETWEILVRVLLASSMTFNILTRRLESKPINYNV